MAKKHKDWLTGEHSKGDMGQLILACLFAAIWIADTFFLRYTTFLNQYIPLAIRIPCGIMVIAAALYLGKVALTTVFAEENKDVGVIDKGIFGVVRHPVYLSEIIIYTGLLIISMSLAAAAVWVITIGFLHWISKYEEKLLLTRFGQDYEKHIQKVPMWFPRLFKK
ncbi:MAG: isoprenylcysteine carboxylmethyltransferase family protein [Chloroflexi bacterium]|nr:isoprenylcysteine carboxylmethyltransferase family protein [Chloroflexota bacterium]MBT7079992.1 isoprenylcysteine carboxylmethyltransferase family protein [Chloroflexota bacterium]MBT7290571.1 isoprenylcysteine carboxylmethyltransferase family protein [Chloroflexota bacterium]